MALLPPADPAPALTSSLSPRPLSSGKGALVRVTSMTKTYFHGGRRLEILRGVDLLLHPSEMMAVVGASGAGKSTLLHLLGSID